MRELLQLPDDRCLCSMSFERQNWTVGIGKSTGFASRTHASRKLFGHHRMLIPKAHSNTYITRLHFFKLPCVSVCLRSTNARINMRRVALQCIVFSVHPSAWPITFPKTHTHAIAQFSHQNPETTSANKVWTMPYTWRKCSLFCETLSAWRRRRQR